MEKDPASVYYRRSSLWSHNVMDKLHNRASAILGQSLVHQPYRQVIGSQPWLGKGAMASQIASRACLWNGGGMFAIFTTHRKQEVVAAPTEEIWADRPLQHPLQHSTVSMNCKHQQILGVTLLQEKYFPASPLEILSYARKTKVPSRVLSLVNKQANKQTYKQRA